MFGPNRRELLAEHSLSTADRNIIEAHLAVIEEYDEQIDTLEDEIERYVLESAAASGLLSIRVLDSSLQQR